MAPRRSEPYIFGSDHPRRSSVEAPPEVLLWGVGSSGGRVARVAMLIRLQCAGAASSQTRALNEAKRRAAAMAALLLGYALGKFYFNFSPVSNTSEDSDRTILTLHREGAERVKMTSDVPGSCAFSAVGVYGLEI